MASRNSTSRSESSESGGDAQSDDTVRPSENDNSDDLLESLQTGIESLKLVDVAPKENEWRLPESVKKLGTWIQESQNILVLTGAGISVSAGIPDFRTHGSGLVSSLFVIYEYG